MIASQPGGRSEAIYQLLLPMKPGDTLPHHRWQSLGGRSDLETARRKFLREQGRALIVEWGVGYRVAKANEHTQIAEHYSQRACRQLRKGRKTVKGALTHHMDEMTTEEVQHSQEFEQRLSKVEGAVRSMKKRQDHFEKVLAATVETKADKSEFDRLREELLLKIETELKKAA